MRAALAAMIATAAVVLTSALAPPAAAQISFGSPGGPPRVALGAGAFDVTPSNHKGAETAAEFRGEYHFGDALWIISPFLGVSATSDGAFYGYGGFGFDINFTPNLVLTPNGAVGYFTHGSGTNLGSVVEFRTGAELAWRFVDQSRIGIAVNHTSNAGIGKSNPGEQSIVLMYSIPIH
jgi:lipid A 3-O-deacylase